MIDESGLSEVLAELAAIWFEKSEHIRVTWNDAGLARRWAKTGNYLTAFQAKVEV